MTVSTWGLSIGSEAAGRIIEFLQDSKDSTLTNAYHSIFIGYAVMGVVNSALVYFMTDACEADNTSDKYAQVSQNDNDNDDFDIKRRVISRLATVLSRRIGLNWTCKQRAIMTRRAGLDL